MNDNQLLAAAAIARGNIVIRNGDDYFDMPLGNWSDDIDDSHRSALSKILQCDEETSRRITWAFPATSQELAISENPVPENDDNDNNADFCQPCSETPMLDEYFKEYDASFTGMKESLDSRHKKMDNLALHQQTGCMGYHPKCEICKMLKRSLTRRYQRKDPHIETRVGHTWGFDLLQNKTESFLGSKYILVMRDFKTGYFKIKFLKTKDQVTPRLD